MPKFLSTETRCTFSYQAVGIVTYIYSSYLHIKTLHFYYHINVILKQYFVYTAQERVKIN